MLHRLGGKTGVTAMSIVACMKHTLDHVSGQIGKRRVKPLMIGAEWNMLLKEMVRIIPALLSAVCLVFAYHDTHTHILSFQSLLSVGLLLDQDEGTLSVYKNGRRLGIMKHGLSGEYCWLMSIQGASNSTAVQIKRGYLVSNRE